MKGRRMVVNSATDHLLVQLYIHIILYTYTHVYQISHNIHVYTRAGSIPDSYDIYRYLNLVRYSIFDTRYFRRKLA